MQKECFVRLPLNKAYNVRDLGGYPTTGGGITKWRVFLRGDDLSGLDGEDIRFLLDYGVKAVVDLRTAEEVKLQPNPFRSVKGVNYTNISLATDLVGDVTRILAENPQMFIREFYLSLLANATGAIERIFSFIADQPKGCTLFHCAAGKDRTGITAMLLLGIAGVDRYDIMTNYEITYTNIRHNPIFQVEKEGVQEELRAKLPENMPMDLMYSKTEYLEPAIEFIMDRYGGFEQYLMAAGVTAGMVSMIKDRFVRALT
jgi:protein-tyrosine phosphatase